MRIQGTVIKWDDDRGFGFIKPDDGSSDLFFHIKGFHRLAGRPVMGQHVNFNIELQEDGKRRAWKVVPVEMELEDGERSEVRRAGLQTGRYSLLAISIFIAIAIGVWLLWKPPVEIAAIYLLMSTASIALYALDKGFAKANAWRIPEGTLHLLSLLGGWPGALIAQQMLRHKSAKAPFLRIFWVIVGVNTAAFIAICSPAGTELLLNLLNLSKTER
jgi:uncharacterized membrane protein YsdA (DUF1294 family)/cold shock CspA family protein